MPTTDGALRALLVLAFALVPAVSCGGRVADERDAGGTPSAPAPGGQPKDCVDQFNSGTPAPCCPDPPPDCSAKPDGYPGYHCVDKHNQFCSCKCNLGQWMCAC